MVLDRAWSGCGTSIEVEAEQFVAVTVVSATTMAVGGGHGQSIGQIYRRVGKYLEWRRMVEWRYTWRLDIDDTESTEEGEDFGREKTSVKRRRTTPMVNASLKKKAVAPTVLRETSGGFGLGLCRRGRGRSSCMRRWIEELRVAVVSCLFLVTLVVRIIEGTKSQWETVECSKTE